MNLRKLNAVISLITTVLLLDHAIFYSVWMLSRGSIAKSAESMPWVLVGLTGLHALLSLAMAVLAHKGREKQKYKTYAKLNVRTMVQRISSVLMLILLGVHIVGSANHFQPKGFHAVVHPLFFAVALAHMAVSTSKSFITAGCGASSM